MVSKADPLTRREHDHFQSRNISSHIGLLEGMDTVACSIQLWPLPEMGHVARQSLLVLPMLKGDPAPASSCGLPELVEVSPWSYLSGQDSSGSLLPL